jgi:hypothetical protein
MAYELEEAPSGRYELEEKPPIKIGREGLPDAVKAVAGDFHPLTQMAVGAKGVWDNAAYKLKKSFGFKLTPEEEDVAAANIALQQESNPALAGAAITAGGAAYPMAAPAANFAAARLGAALPGFLAPAVPAAVAGGVVNAATNPVGDTNKEVQSGMIGGALADLGLRGLGRLAAPVTQSDTVKKLLEKNIIPSPGSAMGGIAKDIEDKLTSLPLVGNLIQNARTRSVQEMGKAAFKEATPPGQQIPEIGKEGVELGKQAFSRAYEGVYQGSKIGLTPQLMKDVGAAKTSTMIPLSEAEEKAFDAIIKREIEDRLIGGAVPTTEAKKVIEANLGKAAFNAGGSPLGDALNGAKKAFRSAMGRSVGPKAAQLQEIDRAYSAFADVKKAVDKADANAGVFTPHQLQMTSKPGSSLESLADDAQKVLPSRVGNSFTVDRALSSLLYTGAASGAAAPLFGAPYLAMLAASPALYSRAGTRYLLGDYAGQQALREQLRALSPNASSAGGVLYDK